MSDFTPSVNATGIPAELQRLKQWLAWTLEHRPGQPKPTKVPYDARTGGSGSSTNPETWSSFEQALTAYQMGGYSGIGFVFSPHDPYSGVDLDHCRDPETGEINAGRS